MHDDTYTGRVVATRHAGTTGSGNPRYTVAVQHADTGNVEILDTAPNASVAYGITNAECREFVHEFRVNARRQITHATRI